MPESNNYSTARDTITAYVKACQAADVESLRGLFSHAAVMSGFYQGEFYIGSPEPFFDEVQGNPVPADSGHDYRGVITSTEIVGDIANVTLREREYMGSNFTNLFHLAIIDGAWLIVSKAYVDE